MPRFGELERLQEHQAGILAILDEKMPLLDGVAAPDIAGLARARWTLMRALTAYSLFKHNTIFDPLIARATPADAHRLLRMKRACLDLGDEFRSYVQRWSASDVGAQWTTYQPAARNMVNRIRQHLAREAVEVAAVLDRNGGLLSRPSPAAPPRSGPPTPAG